VVLYYALGGGLGHLTRAVRVLSALACRDRAVILSASAYARDERVTTGVPVLRVPRRLGHDRVAFRRWVERLLGTLRPERVFVDSFPGGILGELCGMALPGAEHVARRLRWPAYAERLDGPLPRYELTRVLERLDARQAERLSACSERLEQLALPAPSVTGGAPLSAEPHWLVVHSGPDAEVVRLAHHGAARRAAEHSPVEILVISPHAPSSLPAGARWLDVYPITPFFGYAEKVFSAAGFNVMHETGLVRERHEFIPFFRAFDDQPARASENSCLVLRAPGNPPAPEDAVLPPTSLNAPAPSSPLSFAMRCRAPVRSRCDRRRAANP
jgi:hypothetical protein